MISLSFRSMILSSTCFFSPRSMILHSTLKAYDPEKSEEIISKSDRPKQYMSSFVVSSDIFNCLLTESSEYSINGSLNSKAYCCYSRESS